VTSPETCTAAGQARVRPSVDSVSSEGVEAAGEAILSRSISASSARTGSPYFGTNLLTS
jgi:hypothetical protein